MPAAEEDMPKTAFRAGSSGPYKLPSCPSDYQIEALVLSPDQICLGDQQFITLLFEDIYSL